MIAIAKKRTWADIQVLMDRAKIIRPLTPEQKAEREKQKSIANFDTVYKVDADGTERRVDEPRALDKILKHIKERLGDWPRRVGSNLFVHEGNEIHWLKKTPSLFGWLQQKTGVVFWKNGTGMVTKDELFSELCRTVKAYDSIETLPHFPPLAGNYYNCPDLPEGDGRHLSKLVSMFSPATALDGDLIKAMFVTPFWGGEPGSRPAFLITSDEGRGIGKSKLVQMLSRLMGGHIELSSNEDAGKIRTRLLSPDGRRKRLVILDNIKSLRFSWAELEAFITSSSISGHQMYDGEGSRANNLVWVLTLNGASLSTDMAQRVVTIKLKSPQRIGAWETDVVKFIDENREKILADIAFFLDSEPSPIPKHSRWAAWEDNILGCMDFPEPLQSLIQERGGESDVEADEVELIEEFFLKELEELGYEPIDRILIPTRIAAEWLCQALNDRKAAISAAKMLSQFCHEGRTKRLTINATKKYGRGFIFLVSRADEDPESIPKSMLPSINTGLEKKLKENRRAY